MSISFHKHSLSFSVAPTRKTGNVVNLRVFASKKQHDTKQLSLLLQIIAPQIGLLIFKQSHILLVVVLFKCSFSYGCNISGVYVFGICQTFYRGG